MNADVLNALTDRRILEVADMLCTNTTLKELKLEYVNMFFETKLAKSMKNNMILMSNMLDTMTLVRKEAARWQMH